MNPPPSKKMGFEKSLKFHLYLGERESYEEKISIRCYGSISYCY